MSEKKSWWKIGIGTALAGILGLGIEEGIRRGAEIDNQGLAMPDKSSENVSPPKTELKTVGQELSAADKQKIKDLQQTRDVKKFIDKIYEEKPYIDNPNNNLLDRYYKLKWFLNERIGDKFFLGELKSDFDQNGGKRVYFEVNVRQPDGEAGEAIKIEYEADGSISVQDEGLTGHVNIPSDSKMTDSLIDQIHKVSRMRDEFNKYTTGGPDYPTKKYVSYLKSEGYDDAQINYILNTKYKKAEDAIKEMIENRETP